MDPDDLCRLDQAPSEVTVLLLDMSDEFSESQRLKILNELERLVASVPRYALIEAYAVGGIQDVARPLMHLCNPGSGAELSSIYQNPQLAERKWVAFRQRLSSELDALLVQPSSSVSPIFESVQAISLRTFGRPEYDTVPKRLYVVSDLLQNVPGKLSQYAKSPTFEEFSYTPYFSQVRADLSGVEVTLFYLVRPTSPQEWPAHYKFWEAYFSAQGATLERLEPIYGAR